MVKKQDFINKMLEKINKDLNKILPEEDYLSSMYEKLEEYLKNKFLK